MDQEEARDGKGFWDDGNVTYANIHSLKVCALYCVSVIPQLNGRRG